MNIMRLVSVFSQKELGLRSILLTLIATALFSGATLAQTGTSGQITGSIADPNGAVVPDATVTLTQLETGSKRTVTTNTDGNYSIANLGIGTYRLTVTKTGFRGQSLSIPLNTGMTGLKPFTTWAVGLRMLSRM